MSKLFNKIGSGASKLFNKGMIGQTKLFGKGSEGSKFLGNVSRGLSRAGDLAGSVGQTLATAGAVSGQPELAALGGSLSAGSQLLHSTSQVAKQRNDSIQRGEHLADAMDAAKNIKFA